MLKFRRKHLWVTTFVSLALAGAQAAPDAGNETGRKLNPYHEQQLQEQIRKCASGVLACSDTETRCVKQQELCQLLIRSERYDEALQVANNIFQTDNVQGERKAAHHFLLAEIYSRKMKASRNTDEMEKNRQYALSAAQEVVNKKYPSKWRVSEYARTMIRELSDAKYMAGVKQRVSSRESSSGDSAKEAIADAQRRYLDATQGGRNRSVNTVSHSSSKFSRVMDKPVEQKSEVAAVPRTDTPLPSEATVTRSFSTSKNPTAESSVIGSRLQGSGLLTSQPGSVPVMTGKAPLLINGKPVVESTADEIAQNNLAQLLEAARKRKENSRNSSPYATGQNPVTIR